MGISDAQQPDPISLAISGMHCGNCVARVAKALTSVRGVEVDSLSIGHATIRIEPGVGEITNVLGAMARAGYPAEVTSGSK